MPLKTVRVVVSPMSSVSRSSLVEPATRSAATIFATRRSTLANSSMAMVGAMASPPGTAGSGSAAKDYAGHRLEIASILITCADDELKATLLTALHRLKSGLLQCQRTALRVNPVLVEQLQAELTVDPQGKLNELSVTPSTQPLAACVQSRLKSMGGLPPRPAPTKVQIVLKFIAK